MSDFQLQKVAEALNLIPVFVLVLFRVAGMMLFAPLFGSAKVPRRVKLLIAVVLAFTMAGLIKPGDVHIPDTLWGMTLGIGGELIFGLAMGTIVSFVFIAAQWAGEIIGQQMGLNMSEVLDPQFGQANSLIGDLYFMMTMAIFLSPVVQGHRALIRGVRASFDAIPLLSATVDRSLVEVMAGLFRSASELAIQLAAPMLMTMMIVDLTLGCIGRAMPQMNVMAMSVSIRSLLGVGVLLLGLTVTAGVITSAHATSGNVALFHWILAPLRGD